MPWFDLLTGGLGQQNPYDEARTWSDETQRRNRAAVGLDANGNPLPTDANGNPAAPAAADPNNPVNNGQSAAAGQALASGVQQPGQQPSATKTDPSLGHILMDLTQYQQREQGFNQAMGMGFAAVSQPRDREMVSKMFNVNEPDPTKLMQQEQDLAGQQQGVDRTNAISQLVNDPKQGPLIAQKMGVDWGMLKAGILTDPTMIGKIAQVMGTPTEMQRNLGAAQAAIEKQVRLEHPDWTDAQVQAEVNRQAPPSMLLSGVGAPEDQAYRRYAADETAAGRTPMDPVTWKTHNETITKEKDAAVLEYPKIDQKLSENEIIVKRLLANTPATLAALKAWLPTTGRGANIPFIGASQAVKDAARDLQTLQASLKGEGLSGVKNVRNQMEFATLGAAATGALDPNNDEATLTLGLQHLLDKFNTTRTIAKQQAGMSTEEVAKPKEEQKVPKYNPKTGEFE